eukprot:TRINITY_DN2052_c0_g1_i2.p1 TRINITY_DN2052_c0_g1~~TRINITY_DN2052_c0_g1_i2.p1  ORF type:complete len:640 (-),score=176.39 TRINITY_DN2052_c0_g1_i2:231-2150(-)
MATFHQILLVLAALCACTQAFYLPGVSPLNYETGAPVKLKVNKLSSVKTPYPYEYYSIPHCKPVEGIKKDTENLGEVLTGDRIESSPYQLTMRYPEPCKYLCHQKLDQGQMDQFTAKIKHEYRVHMIVDNLPVATRATYTDPRTMKQKSLYDRGFPLGFMGDPSKIPGTQKDVPYLHNHLAFTLLYHADPLSFVGNRIVGFEVVPYSIKHEFTGEMDAEKQKALQCPATSSGTFKPQATDKPDTIVWTYDVLWKPSDIKWASRWDLYLKMTDSQIHWFAIVNALMITFFLTGMVALIMVRTLHRDFSRYNQLDAADEASEETGWKLVHGDVFRPPRNGSLLSVLVGSGVQLNIMCVVTLAFAALGFLSPANRGGLPTAMVLLFLFMSAFAGYSSSRLYKLFRGQAWKTNTLRTAFLIPGIIFIVFMILNFMIWGKKSSGAAPFSTLFLLIVLWFGISAPLVFVGSYFGFRKEEIELPVRTNQIPRQIPEQPWYMSPIFAILIGGVLPFGAVLIELFFILSSLWLDQTYYLFGILLIVYIILVVTCGQITIVFCYFQLCSEDYHWWWRSFFTSGSSALYLFLYTVYYQHAKLELGDLTSAMMYFGYMGIATLGFFLVTGCIGFYSCFWFVRKIYGSIKVD